MTPEYTFWNHNSNSNVAQVNAVLSNQTVECKLRKTYEKLARTEANIHLFISLKNLGLATNDIMSFLKKQTIHKRVHSKPDVKVLEAAMRSKLSDALVFAKRLRRWRDSLKKVLRGMGGSRGGGPQGHGPPQSANIIKAFGPLIDD